MTDPSSPPLHTVYFAFGADAPAADQALAVQRLAPNIDPDRPLLVTGFTDDIGPGDYNDRLARRRADAVARLLVDVGVSGDQLIVQARGRDAYRASNDSREGRARNRRVELRYRTNGPARGGAPLPAGTVPVSAATTMAAPRVYQVAAANEGGSGDGVQVGRYASVAPVPTPAQRDPLASLVAITFPSDVRTVGGALRHLVARTGWRLAGERAADPAMRQVLGLALPASQRELGPMSVVDAVDVVCGEPFAVVVDPVHRLVSCELRGIHARYWRPIAPTGRVL